MDKFGPLARKFTRGNLLDRQARAEAAIRAGQRRDVQVGALEEIAQEIGAMQFRAVDEQGRLRMIMSAINVLDELGISAYFLARDIDNNPTVWLDADNGNFSAGGINGSTGFANVLLHALGLDIQAGIAQANGINWFIGDPTNVANLLTEIRGFVGSVGGGSQMTLRLMTGTMSGKDAILSLIANAASGNYGNISLVGKDIAGNQIELLIDGQNHRIGINRGNGDMIQLDSTYKVGTGTLTLSPINGEQTLYTKTIKGGTLGVDGLAYLELACSHFENTGTIRPITLKLYYGSGSKIIHNAISYPANTSWKQAIIRIWLKANGATNAQLAYGEITNQLEDGAVNGGSRVAFGGDLSVTYAADSTADQDLKVTLVSNGVNAAQYWRLLSNRLSIYPVAFG